MTYALPKKLFSALSLFFAVLGAESFAQSISYLRIANPPTVPVPATSQKDSGGNVYSYVSSTWLDLGLLRSGYSISGRTPSGSVTTFDTRLSSPYPYTVIATGKIIFLVDGGGITGFSPLEPHGNAWLEFSSSSISGDPFTQTSAQLALSFDEEGWGYVTSNGGSNLLHLYRPTMAGGTVPRIFTQPVGGSISGSSGTVPLSVVAVGTTALSYQWYINNTPIAGATSKSYTASVAGSFVVIVNPGRDSVTSATATVTAAGVSPAIGPTIVTQPIALNANAGSSAIFSVGVTGTPPLAYQWRKNGTIINGANASAFTIEKTQIADAANYSVDVSNSVGLVSSSAAVLTVNLPPTVSVNVTSQTVGAGSTATLSVTASNALPLTYQWSKDGELIVGATSRTLQISNIRPADGGTYTVVVANLAGLFSTSTATLAVNFSRLINISTRGFVPAGGSLTPGFVLKGSGSKQLLVRGIGPSLAAFGVSSPLIDPSLAIFPQGSSAPTLSNDDWNSSGPLPAAFVSVGAFALNPNTKDAALLAIFPSSILSGYSARMGSGSAGASGIALAEIYDAEPLNSPVYIVNVSTFGFVGTGDNVLTAGFVIRGNMTKQLLIRAIGPGLASFGAASLLDNPQLQVIANGQTTSIASNSRWGGTAALKAAFAKAGAFAIPDLGNDSAVIVQLSPGGYTVQVSGVGSTTGNALVEIYDLEP